MAKGRAKRNIPVEDTPPEAAMADSNREIIEFLANRFFNSMDRAEALVRYSQDLSEIENRSNEPEDVASDILRSAVVFIHATLEDFLRSLAEILLPYCDEKTLNKIPLVGAERVEKFFLGKLAAHRGKTVQEVIRESVDKYISTKTYNNPAQISDLLVSLGIDIKAIQPLFPGLESLMKRRHKIVHRTDTTQDEIEPITSTQVQEWIDIVNEFLAQVLAAPSLGRRRPIHSE